MIATGDCWLAAARKITMVSARTFPGYIGIVLAISYRTGYTRELITLFDSALIRNGQVFEASSGLGDGRRP